MTFQIESKIKPLVDAINNTKICLTTSSCQGHYTKKDQKFIDRNKSDVRFHPYNGTSVVTIEHFITYLITEFYNRHSFAPINLNGYKLYLPDNNYEPDFVYIIELSPFDRHDNPSKKRKETNKAILQATDIVDEYTKTFIN